MASTPEEKRTVISTAFLFVTGAGLVTFLGVLGFLPQISARLLNPDTPPSYLLLSFSSFTLNYIANLPRTYLRALEASGTFVLVDTGGLFVILALNVIFIAVLKMGLVGILCSSLIVGGVQAIGLSIWTLRKAGVRFSMAPLWEMMRFGLPLIFSNLAVFTLNFADRFFLQHFHSLDTVGVYAVAHKFGFMINYLVIQPFYVMWQTRMFLIAREPEHPGIFGRIFVLYSLLLLFAALGMSLLAPEIARVMVNRQFAASRDVIPIVAFSYFAYGVAYYLQLGMLLSGKTKIIGALSVLCAVFSLGLNYVLISQFGMFGAATAAFLSFTALAAGAYRFSQRAFPLPLPIGRVAGAVCVAAMVYLLSRVWVPGWIAAAVLWKALLLAAFPALLWGTKLLSADEAATIFAGRNAVWAGTSRLLGLSPRKAAGS
jgi:O-antigen/teichoic acid export membrane protein